ncbi:MAG TPA: YceI family protein [Terracidiphilus sp.]|nr:YceI family protein [Terracidiphilus sp.]
MIRGAFLSAILALTAPLVLAQNTTWVPDKPHCEVAFSVLHLSLSNVRGRFGNMGGNVIQNAGDITKSTVNLTIDVSSVDTGVAPRDNDLKSANFFDVAKFPTATFTSTSIARNGGGLTIDGNLTLHGVTKPVVLEAEGPTGPVQGMDHKPHEGFSATSTISRAAFGIGPKYPNSIVGDDVKLTIDVDLVQQ